MNTPQDHKVTLNTNTGISLGIVGTLLVGFAWVITAQSGNSKAIADMKSELSMQALTTKTELLSDIKDLKTRMTAIEAGKNTWTSTDQFRWAVHLQQANPQIKVPEPETESKK